MQIIISPFLLNALASILHPLKPAVIFSLSMFDLATIIVFVCPSFKHVMLSSVPIISIFVISSSVKRKLSSDFFKFHRSASTMALKTYSR